MKASDHARDFLIAVDPDGSLPVIARQLLATARTDEKSRAALRRVSDWIDKQARRFHDDGLAGAARRALAPAIYLRAVERLRVTAGALPTPFVDLGKHLPAVPGVLERLEDAFLSELLCEVERRAFRDSAFAERLASASARLQTFECAGFCEELDAMTAPGGTHSGQKGSPRTAAAPSGGRCRDYFDPVTCGVIFVAVVVIVVVAGAAK